MMKKSLVAVGVIVALGVVWTGAAWYTGKQLEGRMAEMVSNANVELKKAAPDSGLIISYQGYERGLFHSRTQLVIQPAPGAEKSFLKPGQSIILNEVIDNGPFPFAQLKRFNLIPSMASIQTELVNNATTKPLFDIAAGKSPVAIQTRVGYGGNTDSAIKLLPLNYASGADKITFSGGEFNAAVDSKGDGMTINGHADSGLVNTLNHYGQHVQITFNGINTDGDSKRSLFDQRIGKQKISVDKLAIAIEGKELAIMEGFAFNATTGMQEDKQHFTGQFAYTLDALKMQNQNMGSSKLTLKLGNIDGQALHDFSQKYNAESQKLMNDEALMQQPDIYQQKIVEVFAANLPILLKGNPVITIAPLSWKNDKGEATFNLSLFLKDPQSANGPAKTPEEQLDRYVKSLDSKLVLPMEMATRFMTQVAQLEGYQPDEAVKLADQQVKGLAAMGQMFRISKLEDNNITSSLQYANGKASLNGEAMSLSDLLGMFALPTGPDDEGGNAAPQQENAPAAQQ